MSTIKFDTWRNSDNTENGKVRALVNFNGTGTVAIRRAINVSSITDNGVGDYTINFTSALPSADYCVGACGDNSGASAFLSFLRTNAALPTTTSVRVGFTSSAFVSTDVTYGNVIVAH